MALTLRPVCFSLIESADSLKILGKLRDDKGNACYMIHDIIWDGGTRVFAGETDNVDRCSFLWEAHLG